MKIFFSLILFIFLKFSSFAQVEAIGEAAQALAENSNEIAECCIACADPIFIQSFEFLFIAAVAHHENLIDNYENKKITSLDLFTNIAYDFDKQVHFLPEVRLNWGVLSTQFKYNYLQESKNDSTFTYKTWHWQLLQLNIYPSENFIIRFGAGIFYDYFVSSSYNEFFLGLELNSENEMFFVNIEGRYCDTYHQVENRAVYREANARFNLKILDTPHFWTYLSIGGIYHNYYGEFGILSGQVGLNFNFH